MYEYPFQDVNNFCVKCEHLEKAYFEKENNALTFQTLGKMREMCTKCRGGAWSNSTRGIYKADAILGAYSPPKRVLPLGKGRKSKIPVNVVKAIIKQAEEGVSFREIARRTGYSVPTISKVVRNRF